MTHASLRHTIEQVGRGSRLTAPPVRLFVRLWGLLAATDPGLLRLQLAGRGTLSVGLTATVLTVVAHLTGRPLTDFAVGVVLSMVGTFLLRDSTRRARQVTLLALLPPAAVAVCITSFVHAVPLLGEAFFLVLVFAATVLQTRHPRALGMGLIAVILTYVGLYLKLPPATLPWQFASLLIGAAMVAFVCFVLLPLRPAATLRRAVSSVLRRAAAVLHEAEQGSEALPRRLARLNEAALAAEDQLILLDEPSRVDVRLHLFALEQAVRLLVDQVALGAGSRQRSRLRVAVERLRVGRPRAPMAQPADPLSGALAMLARAATGLQEAAARAVASAGPLVVGPAAVPGPLGWRAAAQVTLASLVAMLGGMALSPERWFWAVIAVYVVFLNARSRGDTIHKGSHRIVGTLAGLFGGLGIAVLTAGSLVAASGAMLLAVFGTFYLYAVSYSAAIFCVTVLLGMVYGALGNPLEPLLMLRLEETALGVAAAMLAASFVWPIPTRRQVRLSGVGVLRALGEVVAASVAESSDGGLAAIVAVRLLDRQLSDLRLALVPVMAGRFIMRRAREERPVTALLACADAARDLAAASARLDCATRMKLVPAAVPVARRIEALIGGQAMAALAEPCHPGGGHPSLEALYRLDLALAMLGERVDSNFLDGFAVE